MKKLMKSLMLFAAAAMALTSCENEAMNEGIEANDTYTMNFVAGAPESKTSVNIADNIATFSWAEEGETFTFVQNTAEGLKKGTAVTFNYNEGLAEITATFTEATSPIVAVYPEAAWVTNENTNYNKIKLIVPSDQDILVGTFDPNADLLVSKEVTPENTTDTHLLEFARLVAVGKMTIKNLPVEGTEVIEKVNFSIDSENALSGRLYIDLETAEVSEWGYYGQANKYVNLVDGNVTAAAENEFFFTCMPATVAAGETFTVEVTTNVATYTHSVTIPEGKSIDFTSGRVSAFGVNMQVAERVANTAIALPWTESFDNEEAVSKYDTTNGGGTTAFYAEALAGGTTGEILIAKSDGSMTATIASDGTAKTLYFWFKSNKDFIEVSSATENVTINKVNSKYYTITLAEGVKQFKLTLTNSNSGNARVDDIVLTTEAPAIESITLDGAKTSFTVGDAFTSEGLTVTAVYSNGATEDVTASAAVDSSAVDMNTADDYTVTVAYGGKTANYTITVSKPSAVQTKTVTYTVTSSSAVSVSGEAPTGASATYQSTYNTKCQLTNGNSMTLTLSNYAGVKITGLTMSMKSNSSKGAGNYSMNVGNTTISSIATAKFNTASWNGAWSTSYVDVTPSVTATTVGADKNIVITIAATENSLYCQSFTLTYEVGGTSGGGSETPDPEPTKLDTPTNLQVETNELEVSLSWTGSANATSYYVTCGDKNTTVDTTSAQFTMEAAGTYNITVVAKADGYTDSDALNGSANVTESTGGGDVTTPSEQTVEMDIKGTTGTLASDSSYITWTSGDVTFTNTKGSTAIRTSDSSHYRAYEGSGITISVAEGTISKVVITCVNNNYQTVMKTSFTNAGYTVSTSGTTVTVTGSGSSFTATASAQTRLSKIEVTYTK